MTQSGSVVVGYLHPGNVDSHFLQALEDMLAFDTEHDRRLLWPPIRNESGIDLAKGRNEVTEAFLNLSPGEWLLMVDTDMGFAPDSIDRLLASADPRTAPIVGGLCFSQRRAKRTETGGFRHNPFPTIYRWVDHEADAGFAAVEDYPRDQMVPCSGTGAAFLLIHRTVLESIRAKYGQTWWSQLENPKRGGLFSEDLSFCIRAAGVDCPIHVDTRVKTCHRKTAFLDEWLYDNLPRVKPPYPDFVVVGTGRSGTGYMAKALSALGVPCGHETMFTPYGYNHRPDLRGDSSWLAASLLDEFDGQVLHITRDPLAVVGSLVGIGMFSDPGHDAYAKVARKFLSVDLPADDDLTAAVRFYVAWNDLIDKHAPDAFRFQVEDPPWKHILRRVSGPALSATDRDALVADVSRDTNHRDHAVVEWADIPAGPDRDALIEMAGRYGYEVPDDG